MGCTLQYSTDGGTTWTDVPGWDSYFADCVGGSTGGGGGAPPPDVPGLTGDVLACNMAGYLIQTLLRQVVMDAITKVVASGFLQDVIDTIVALIPGIDATTPLVIAATDALFTALATGGLATIAAGALTDLVLVQARVRDLQRSQSVRWLDNWRDYERGERDHGIGPGS